jgi:flagellar biosynthesis chaperone FliJ
MNDDTSTTPEKVKRQRPLSRPKRWAKAVQEAASALSTLEHNLETVESALSDLYDVQQEYIEWKDNLPESLQSSPLGEKLDEVISINLEDAAQPLRDAFDEVREAVDTAESIDLPQGFGRD